MLLRIFKLCIYHTFYFLYIYLSLHQPFAVLRVFSLFLINFLIYYFYNILFCLLFLFFSCCSYSCIYVNLLYLPLCNFFFFFLFLCSFSPCLLICFAIISFFPSWHIALILFSSLCFRQWLISFLLSFSHQVHLLYFLFSLSFWTVLVLFMCVCVYIYSIILCQYQPDFAFAICLGFAYFSCFSVNPVLVFLFQF